MCWHPSCRAPPESGCRSEDVSTPKSFWVVGFGPRHFSCVDSILYHWLGNEGYFEFVPLWVSRGRHPRVFSGRVRYPVGSKRVSMRITCLSFCCTPAALFIPWQLSLPHMTALFTTHDSSLYHTCIHNPLYQSGSIFHYYPSTPALVTPVTLSLPLVHQQPTLPFRQTHLLITRYRQPSLPL